MTMRTVPPPPIRLDRVMLCRGGRVILSGLTGVFEPGSLTAVTGPNGAGKSTLLQALGAPRPLGARGLWAWSRSTVSEQTADGDPVGQPLPGRTIGRQGGRSTERIDRGRIDRGGIDARSIALLPQDGRVDRAFPINCRDVVALGWAARIGLFRRIGPEHYTVADHALAKVGLRGLGHQLIDALSVGQFQRVLFARTIVRDAPVIMLDEPFTAVDAETADILMAIIRGWHRQGRTVIAVLHDLDLIRAEFPDTLLLSGDPCSSRWGETGHILGSGQAMHVSERRRPGGQESLPWRRSPDQ